MPAGRFWWWLAWSPGDRLLGLFGDPASTDRVIWRIDPDGAGAEEVVVAGAVTSAPAWSPAGDRLAYVSDRDGGAQVFAMNADGSGGTRLAGEVIVTFMSLQWSPDGRLVVYPRVDAAGELTWWAVAADGSSSRAVSLAAAMAGYWYGPVLAVPGA